jgi:hypothetical protein
MITRLIPAVVFAAVLASAGAQNLVVNGHFDAGNSNGWTQNGYSQGAQVSSFDTTGVGASDCFNCRPGGQTTPPPYLPNSIEQDILQIQGLDYLFVADLAVARIVSVNNADAGTIEVFVDNVLVTRHAFGSYTAPEVKRERLCARYTATATGQKTLKITFHRTFLTNTNTPTSHIDNISLLQVPFNPVICPRGERKLGGTLNLEVDGKPNAQFGLFVSLSQLPSGFPVPGFSGLWWMGPLTIQVLTAGLDAQGAFKLVQAIPNQAGLAGTPLYWQAIQVSGPLVTMGELARFGFYQ